MSRGVGKSRKWSSDAHFPKVIHNFFHKKQRSGGEYFFAWATGHISYVKSRFHGNTKAPLFGAFVLSSSSLLRPVSSGSQGPQVALARSAEPALARQRRWQAAQECLTSRCRRR